MDNFSEIGITGVGSLWIFVHLLGLAAAWLVRLQAGKRFETLVQGGFLAALLLVSLATVVGYLCCQEIWPLSAGTLALMVVLAITELETTTAHTATLER
jgi:hypothetical protein